MKDKNLPNDIKSKSLDELKELANNIVNKLENKKNFENSVEEYQQLIRLNNFIEKKFQSTSREISNNTSEKINKILKKKNEKKTR